MRFFIVNVFFVFLMSLSLLGCGSGLTLKINSAGYLNPNVSGQPSPIVLTFLELRKDVRFKEATYHDLTHLDHVLKSDLIDKHLVEIRPSSQKNVEFDLSQGTHFLGFFASFRDITQSEWRTIIPVKKTFIGKRLDIFIGTKNLSVRER